MSSVNTGTAKGSAARLRVEQNGKVRRLTLASPAQRNMLDAALANEILAELDHAESDVGTRAILIDAEGPVFCGGLDLSAMELSGELPERIFTFGRQMEKPVVVAAQGVAISAGVGLMANAHIVVAAQGSSFGLTDVRVGSFHPGLLRAVTAALGERRTRELALTGRVFTTPEALAWGLVHLATPAFELEDRALHVATGLAGADPESVRAALRIGLD